MHARERGIQSLERRCLHRAHANRAARQKQDVGHFDLPIRSTHADLADERTHAVAKGHQPHERFGNIAHQAGNGKLAPHQQVAQKNGPKAHGELRRAPHTLPHGRKGGGRHAGGGHIKRPPGSGVRLISGKDLPGWRVGAKYAAGDARAGPAAVQPHCRYRKTRFHR